MIDLSFKNVSKRYRVRQEVSEDQTRNRIVRKIQNLRRVSHDFWALRDVSFEVRRSEAVGIIGHNGAGKSTILKLLANITAPTTGEIKINGRLSALIEVGSGFHPELTGRENIYLNGSILGMRRREITEKLDSIVEFAGIREFLDTPVKRFSSGMYVRLGFSIAAHLDPDILLLDEVLAVGDAAFQAKCLQRIDELKNSGTTIIFVSHDLSAVERVCDRVLYLKAGAIKKDGLPREVIETYNKEAQSSPSAPSSKSNYNRSVSLRSLVFCDYSDVAQSTFVTGEPLKARVELQNSEPLDDVVVDIIFYTPDGNIMCELTTEVGDGKLSVPPGVSVLEFACEELSLLGGIYYTDVRVIHRGGIEAIDVLAKAATVRVDDVGHSVRGLFYQPYQWQIKSTKSLPLEPASSGSSEPKFTPAKY